MNLSTIKPSTSVQTANVMVSDARQKELEERVPQVFENILSEIEWAAKNKKHECALDKASGYVSLYGDNQRVIHEELCRRGFKLAHNKTEVVWDDFTVRQFLAK